MSLALSKKRKTRCVVPCAELSKEQWIGVLRLSRKWDMPEVRLS